MKKLFFIISLILTALACDKTPTDDKPGQDPDPGQSSDKGAPISVVDGKVRFYVDCISAASVRDALGITTNDLTGCKLSVNGTDYNLEKDQYDNWYAEVLAASGDTYDAVLLTRFSASWYDGTPYKDLIVPFSQFRSATRAAFKNYPRYASYSKENGNVLIFKDAVALLDLRIKGSGSLSSVKVLSPAGEIIAGKAACTPSKPGLQMTEGLNFAVVNCTESGKFFPISAEGTSVPVILAPASLSSGLEITICSSDHRMMRTTISPGALKAGTAVTQNIDFSPDADLVWYEGFDNCVWGGNIMAGENSTAYAPDDAKMGISDGRDRDGYADCFTPVACTNPGTGFIQSNTWSEVSGKDVASSHVVSNSYITSRSFNDWRYLFRCQEYQGLIAVGSGEGNKARGVMQTPAIGNIPGVADITVEFKFCFQNGAGDNLLFQLVNAGHITGLKIDGKESGAKPTHISNASKATVNRTKVTIPASALEPKTWHTATVIATNATDGTFLYFAGENPNASTVHGFYIDDITVRRTSGAEKKGTLRLLYWNIQNGMWADKPNNYDNFVAFVKKYDPDICVWCEAATIYKDYTNTSQSSSQRFLPSGWETLAARYGHKYTALGGQRDNYPQEITSKYPINTLEKITTTSNSSKPISHGAALHQVTGDGRTLHFVTCHMWPQSYGYNVATANRDASSAAHEGDYYRQYEMDYLISHTVNAAAYASVTDWILLGDLNSRSRLDNWYLSYPDNDTRFITQDVVLNKTSLKDVIYEWYPAPDNYISSTGGSSRIDFVYVSAPLMKQVANALIIGDKWAEPIQSTHVSSFYEPSDHRPILVDFDLTK